MDKSIIELADHAQIVLAKIEAHLKVERTESEKNCERLAREVDLAESDEDMDEALFTALCNSHTSASRQNDHIVAAHKAALTALNSIIDVWTHAREIK